MTPRRQKQIALLVAGCLFMELLDGTIVTTSAPQIARSLSVAPSVIGLLVTAYMVTLAALVPVSGWVSARFGTRPVFLAAIVVFALSSLGCALSTSLPELVAMRVLQGAGGAMMVPVGRFVVLARAEKADLMRVTAFLIWPALLAPVLAPIAGGAITTYANWHWLFLINVPLAALAFLVAWRLVVAPPQPPPAPLDRVGVALSATGLAGLTAAAGLLSGAHPNWGVAGASAAGAGAVLALAARHLLRSPAPLINLRTLRIPTFGASIAGFLTFGLAVGAAPFLVPLLFQEVFHWSAVKSGAIVLFIFVGNVAIKPATTPIYGRAGFRAVLVIATVGLAATLAAAGFLTAATPLPLIGALLLVSGVARSVGATGYSTIAFTDVPAEQMRDANTVQATVLQLSAGFGVAAGTIALQVGRPLARALGEHADSAPYTVAFLLMALISLAATVGALRLHPSAGNVLRGGRGRAAAVARGAASRP